MTELLRAQQAALAEAAREFVHAERRHRLYRFAETKKELEKADERMYWLVDAMENGWHPDEFVSELE